MIHKPSFNEEQLLWQKGYRYVAGVDEVGRGAFAGPVVAAAVILPVEFPHMDQINDSKVLSAKKRELLSEVIIKHAVSFSIARIDVPHINRWGIGKASQMAFRKAIKTLTILPDFILIDGFYVNRLKKSNQKPIIAGDKKSISIAAASIIAKVYRDNLMKSYAERYAQYAFHINKGYGTKAHREAIKAFGICDFHRTSFNLARFLI